MISSWLGSAGRSREPTMDEKVTFAREQERLFKAKHLAAV